jgi:pimeloyl-ACP methyl ester carboxylesterase
MSRLRCAVVLGREVEVRGAGDVRLSATVFPGPSGVAPGLLLHHGLASSRRIWDLMLPGLVRTFRVVTYDARGHGRSAKPTAGYGFDRTVADAAAVIRTTRLRRPIIVGHSWGAMVALAFAASRPRSVSGAVLVDGGVTSLASSMTWPETKEQLAPPHLAGMPLDEFRTLIRTISGDAFEVTPEIEGMVLSLMHVDRGDRIRPRLSRANHFRILRAIWELDPLALWARVRVPTLALLASADRADDQAGTEAKRRAAREVRKVTDPRVVQISWMQGIHDLPVQRPHAVVERIRRFARRVVR